MRWFLKVKVILLEKTGKLGGIGAVADVKDGYARNFLLPFKKAIRYTEENMRFFEEKKAEIEKQNNKLREEASKKAAKMQDLAIKIVREASESGMLYGSVRAGDICNTLAEQGFDVEKRYVEIPAPIRTVGLHAVRIVFHPEVVADISVNVLTPKEQEFAGTDEAEDSPEQEEEEEQ